MKKILGGKEGVCPSCAGTMIYLQVGKYEVISQCKECRCAVKGRVKDKIKIYSY